MPKPTIKHLEENLNKAYAELSVIRKENYDLKERIKQIAGENEGLRMDKKWLQSIISPLAQAIHTRS